MNGLFFTGTDTAVGKTYVAAAVARLLRQQGRCVRVSKPVATGAERVEGRWLNADTVQLQWSAGGSQCLDDVTPWSFPEPLAPAVAGRLHGQVPSIRSLADAARSQGRPEGILLVEGVGGLLCPLTDRETVADLAAVLGLPLVVVARRSLGTLNHTLLTLEAAAARDLAVAGLVVNETEPPSTLAEETNVAELQRRSGVPLLAVVPHRSDGASDNVAALAEVDWWRLASVTQTAVRGNRPGS
jgi:dethiobiotin synthetase